MSFGVDLIGFRKLTRSVRWFENSSNRSNPSFAITFRLSPLFHFTQHHPREVIGASYYSSSCLLYRFSQFSPSDLFIRLEGCVEGRRVVEQPFCLSSSSLVWVSCWWPTSHGMKGSFVKICRNSYSSLLLLDSARSKEKESDSILQA